MQREGGGDLVLEIGVISLCFRCVLGMLNAGREEEIKGEDERKVSGF